MCVCVCLNYLLFEINPKWGVVNARFQLLAKKKKKKKCSQNSFDTDRTNGNLRAFFCLPYFFLLQLTLRIFFFFAGAFIKSDKKCWMWNKTARQVKAQKGSRSKVKGQRSRMRKRVSRDVTVLSVLQSMCWQRSSGLKKKCSLSSAAVKQGTTGTISTASGYRSSRRTKVADAASGEVEQSKVCETAVDLWGWFGFPCVTK